MLLGKTRKVTHIVSYNAAAMHGGRKQLHFIRSIFRNPFIGRAAHVVTAGNECGLKRPNGDIRIQMQT